MKITQGVVFGGSLTAVRVCGFASGDDDGDGSPFGDVAADVAAANDDGGGRDGCPVVDVAQSADSRLLVDRVNDDGRNQQYIRVLEQLIQRSISFFDP